MNAIIKLLVLSTLTISVMTLSLTGDASVIGQSSVRPVSDDCDKKRGRDREKCLQRKNRSDLNNNQNSNSNSDQTSGNSNSNSNSNDNPTGSAISRDQARTIALNRVPGTLVKEEFEQKRGRAIYEIYIRKTNGDLFEVYVDANNGNVVKVESKNDDDD